MELLLDLAIALLLICIVTAAYQLVRLFFEH